MVTKGARFFFVVAIFIALFSAGTFFILRSHAPAGIAASPAADLAASSTPAYTDEPAADGEHRFASTQYSFSLEYPSDLIVAARDEGANASTFTFEDDTTAQGFQIFIVPFSGSQITDARFKEDEPSGVRDSLQSVTIDGATGASFFGKSDAIGDTAEVWFVRGGYLYEVTALKLDAQWLSNIMASWKFP